MKTYTPEEIVAKFQYSFACTPERIELDEGFTLEIVQCSDSNDNPQLRGDCETPAIWLTSGADLSEYDNDLKNVLWNMSLGQIARKWKAVADILDMTHAEVQKLATEYKRDWGGCINNARQNVMGDALNDLRSQATENYYNAGYLETLSALFRLNGIPAETFVRNGYSQGDEAHGLLVMTPEWKERVGAPHATMRRIKEAVADMSLSADEYAAWIWGDVYGFRIEDETGTEVESCYGFYVYGDLDPIKSGIAEAICESLNSAIANATVSDADEFETAMIEARPDLAPAYL
jgi:hypothetical protein